MQKKKKRQYKKFTSLRSETKSRASSDSTLAGNAHFGQPKLFNTLHMSMNDCESTVNINLGGKLHFGEDTNLQRQNM